MPILFFFLSIFLILNNSVSAKTQYHSPLESPLIVSGTFGEFRKNHFHGGVDFSTQRQIGKKVFAVEDGTVWRIKIAPNGYGNAVYLKLKDGHVAVYAHLDRFSEKIKERVLKYQNKHNRSFVDFYLSKKEIPVKKGELIAFSGDSGGVPPHLHFELRDSTEVLLNPLTHGFDVPDTTIPIVKELLLLPLQSKNIPSSPNYWKKIFLKKNKSNSTYTLPIQTVFSEQTGIELDLTDRSFGNKCAPAKIEVWVDDELIFTRDYSRFNFTDFPHSFTVYNKNIWLKNKKLFERLYEYPSSDLSFHLSKTKTKGAITLKKGESKKIQIKIEDAAHNEAQIKFNLVRSDDPKKQIIFKNRQPNPAKKEILAPNKKVKLNLKKKDLFFSTPITIEKIPTHQVSKHFSKKDKPSLKSPIYEISPADLVLRGKILLTFFHSFTATEKAQIYQFDPHKVKWRFLKNQSRNQKSIQTKIKDFGQFALLQDQQPPQVIKSELINNPNQTKWFCLYVKDNLSGVDFYKIKASLNQTSLRYFVDLNRSKITILLPETFSQENGPLKIILQDFAQNQVVKEFDL